MPVPISSKERILDLIQANPFVSQQELAERLGLTRSAVASHIAQLTRDGRLLGRAYILPGTEPILVAGGANLDRIARCAGPVAMGSSNPVSVTESFGGVARNVAENLARVGLPVRLLTAVGDDPAGTALLRQARELGMDTGACLVAADRPTGTYTALLQPDGEMVLALADMDVMDRLTREVFLNRRSHWASTRLRVADCNLPGEVLDVLVEDSRREGVELILVAVSEPKMKRLPERLEGVSAMILNRGELAARLGYSLKNRKALFVAARALQAQGVARVVVTLGAEGVLCIDGRDEPVVLPAPKAHVVDVTGAGDAFSAGLVAGLVRFQGDLRRACRLGLRLAALTLASASSVAPTLSPVLLDEAEPYIP
jgi:pseudouridine kinase